MPIAGMLVTERPGDSGKGQTAVDLLVQHHVDAIVVIDEVMTQRLSENQPGQRGEQETRTN